VRGNKETARVKVTAFFSITLLLAGTKIHKTLLLHPPPSPVFTRKRLFGNGIPWMEL